MRKSLLRIDRLLRARHRIAGAKDPEPQAGERRLETECGAQLIAGCATVERLPLAGRKLQIRSGLFDMRSAESQGRRQVDAGAVVLLLPSQAGAEAIRAG